MVLYVLLRYPSNVLSQLSVFRVRSVTFESISIVLKISGKFRANGPHLKAFGVGLEKSNDSLSQTSLIEVSADRFEVSLKLLRTATSI